MLKTFLTNFVEKRNESIELLIHGDGIQNSKQIIDSTENHSLLVEGDYTYIDTNIKKIGTGSVYLDGITSRIKIPNSEKLLFGTNDFTIECWVYRLSKPTPYPRIIHFGAFWSNQNAHGLMFDDTEYPGKITYSSFNLGGRLCISTTTVQSNQWYHICITRSSGVFRLFVNGILESTNSSKIGMKIEGSSIYNNACIGAAFDSLREETFHGHIDEIIVIKNSALYTSNFTPRIIQYEI